MNQKKRKPGRPKLPKGEAKDRALPAVRFDSNDLRLVTAAAKAANQELSEWIRDSLRSAAEVQMFNGKLHEAMQDVLLQRADRTATTSEISDEIERKGSYVRKDGKAARANQINARVRQYRHLFKFIAPGIVKFVGNPISS